MARLQWRIQFEALWHPDLPALANQSIEGLRGKDRIRIVRSREAAQALIQSLFPEDIDGIS